MRRKPEIHTVDIDLLQFKKKLEKNIIERVQHIIVTHIFLNRGQIFSFCDSRELGKVKDHRR